MNVKDYNKTRIIEQRAAYRIYKNKVDRLTEKIAHLVPGIEKRKWREWDLDHIIPISFGFKNNIPPENMALLSNLQVIPHQSNAKKGQKVRHSLTHIGLQDDNIKIAGKKRKHPIYLGGYYTESIR
jgi:hypothetical protein